MLIGVPKETWPGELRAALVPQNVKKLVGAGFSVTVESGVGAASGLTDDAYAEAGAEVSTDRAGLLGSADVVLKVRKPEADEVSLLKRGSVHVSFLDPFNERGLIDALAAQEVTAISMEMVPRSTRAQKMDALSSQANLAGYVTVIQAAFHCPKIFPMMMTPAGTHQTGARVRHWRGRGGFASHRHGQAPGRTRRSVRYAAGGRAEQVQSLGAKFVEIDLGDTGQTDQGYAKELTAEQLELQTSRARPK